VLLDAAIESLVLPKLLSLVLLVLLLPAACLCCGLLTVTLKLEL
jgi:hypothetical protein